MARKRNVRHIHFGIRFKFSILMILGISFASALIGLAVYNQHENKIKETILRLSSTILKGAADEAEIYLRNRHVLYSDKSKDFTDSQKRKIKKQIEESGKNMSHYFSTIVKKEEILDIAFIIDINWKDVDVSWKRKDQARYKYFNRKSGNLFELSHYYRRGKPIKGTRGRNDTQLKPTIFTYFMENIHTDSYLAFTKGRKNDDREFVIAGIPIFNYKKNARLYEKYIKFKETRLTSKDTVKKHNREKSKFQSLFIKRIIDHNMNLEYDLVLNTNKRKRMLKYFYKSNLDTSRLSKKRKMDLRRSLYEMINESIEDNKLSLFRIKVILNTIQKEYNLSLNKNQKKDSDFWKKFYYFNRRNGIRITTTMSLDELSLISFRKDLNGVLGLFLLRNEFYTEMQANRAEIVNLILSILLRAIVVALFFPTFIIRAINTLEEGAFEIGKGNLEKRIELKGSDEIGRLADIFNAMTGNLKKAQVHMLEKQRMHEELKTAQEIQATLLPAELPSINSIEFGAYYEAQTESGGDYYDFIELGNNSLGIAIADVSGHGVGSGLVMAVTRTLLHTYCKDVTGVKIIFEKINEYLYENTASNYFVTMFYGILNLNTMKLRFSSAGHSHGIIIRNKKLNELPAGGIALGATSNTTLIRLIEEREFKLQKGDYFIQYTDGVDESMNANNEEFGVERFHKALAANYGKSPQEMIKSVVKTIDNFTGKVPQHDDITLIALRIK